jgi:hypothetical protein
VTYLCPLLTTCQVTGCLSAHIILPQERGEDPEPRVFPTSKWHIYWLCIESWAVWELKEAICKEPRTSRSPPAIEVVWRSLRGFGHAAKGVRP